MAVQLDRNCQFCPTPTPATWDAKHISGPWGYMCDNHFKTVAHPAYAQAATRLVPETPKPEPVVMGQFKIEFDLEARTLAIVNEGMKVRLLIGDDQLDVTDLECKYITGIELPV